MRALAQSLAWLFLPRETHNFLLLQRDVNVSNLEGYPGIKYQAIHYEPLCGSLGTDDRYHLAFDISSRCTLAIEAFEYGTNDTVAIYNVAGAQVENAILGNGEETCLCFSLRHLSGDLRSGICIWISEVGQVEKLSLDFSYGIAGSHRPNITKALPLCEGSELDDSEPFQQELSRRGTTFDADSSTIQSFSVSLSPTATKKGTLNIKEDSELSDRRELGVSERALVTDYREDIFTTSPEPTEVSDYRDVPTLSSEPTEEATSVELTTTYSSTETDSGVYSPETGGYIGTTTTLGGMSPSSTTTSVQHFSTSTFITTILYTDNNGFVATTTGTVTTEVPQSTPSASKNENGGLSRSDIIAIAIGVPSTIGTILGWACWRKCCRCCG